MAFTFKKVENLRSMVLIEMQGNHGKSSKGKIDVEFKKLKSSEIKEIAGRIQDPEDDFNEATVIMSYVTDIKGLKDEDKNDIPFNDELLELICEEFCFKQAIISEFFAIQTGEKTKN